MSLLKQLPILSNLTKLFSFQDKKLFKKSKEKSYTDDKGSNPRLFSARSRTLTEFNNSSSSSTPDSEKDTRPNSVKSSGKVSVEFIETPDGDVADAAAYNPSTRLKLHHQDIFIKRTTQDDDYESIRIIVLGICNSGKSTFVKYLKIGFGDGFSQHELELYHHLILDNMLQCIKNICNAMIRLKIPFEDDRNEDIRNQFMAIHDSNSVFDMYEISGDDDNELFVKFRQLSSDNGFQEALSRGNEYNLLPNAKILLESFERIVSPDYIPTERDILISRNSSQVISNEVIKPQNQLPIKVQDFGGYRFQRLKWYSFFTRTIDATVFVHSLSSYDQMVEEENTVSQFDESLRTFAEVANEMVIEQMPLILILSKKDEFLEKMKSSKISRFHPDFEGDENSYQEVIEFIKKKFISVVRATDRPFFVYIANLLDTPVSQALWKVVVKQARKCHEDKKKA